MFKSILLALTLAISIGASTSAHAGSFGMSIGGRLGSGSSCTDTTTTGCWCKCMTFGSDISDCNVATFIDPRGNVCAYCYGDDCATDLGFGDWSIIL